MDLKILWMYNDLMDLYGDKGNIQVLKTRALKRNINVTVKTCSLNEEVDINDYDLFFLGGGADYEQNLIFEDLLKRKDSIVNALNHSTTFLLICGGYQLFGKYYLDQDGNKIDGLGIFDYYTENAIVYGLWGPINYVAAKDGITGLKVQYLSYAQPWAFDFAPDYKGVAD